MLTVKSAAAAGGSPELERLESLILVYHSNRRLLGLLERIKGDLDRAKVEQMRGDTGAATSRACVLRTRRRKVLRQLEANWQLIRELVTLPEAEAEAEAETVPAA